MGLVNLLLAVNLPLVLDTLLLQALLDREVVFLLVLQIKRLALELDRLMRDHDPGEALPSLHVDRVAQTRHICQIVMTELRVKVFNLLL